MKRKQGKYLVVERGNFSTESFEMLGLSPMYATLLMWSAADLRIIVRQSETSGSPAVSIWNEKSKRLTQLTFSSWETLLSALLQELRESPALTNEEYSSASKTLALPDGLSWLRFILHTFSETPDRIQFSPKMLDVLPALLEASCKLSRSDVSLLQQAADSEH
jgi:hypothetical protein